jgi:signal transduction histidine kinase
LTNIHQLTDKIILFFACFCIYVSQPVFDMNIVPIIMAVILSSLMSYIEWNPLKLVLNFIYIGLCAVMPPLTVFIPLFYYDLFLQRNQLLLVVMMISLFLSKDLLGFILFITTAVLAVISLWLKKRTEGLCRLTSRNHQLADDARELSVQLKAQNKELLEGRDNAVYLATLTERNRIAREIHDNLGHQLSSAILQIGALLAVNKEEELKESLTVVNTTLSQAMTSIRESVHDLHDQSVDLHRQIEELLGRFTFCEVRFEDQLMTQPDKLLKLALISIIKEALSNIMRHSDASQAYILLREHPAFYQLIIRDNGSARDIRQGSGMGLINMSDRVQGLGGNINFRNEEGFEIFISIPKGEVH